MSIFTSLFINLLPLYIIIALGYISGRYLKTDRRTLAALGIDVFIPVVTFGFIADMDFKLSYITLPVFYYSASVIIGMSYYILGKKIYSPDDNHVNLIAMCSSMANIGYFGLPLVLMIFNDNNIAAIYVLMMSGGTLYQATFGYYYAARSNFSVKESLKKLARFPMIYAFIAGLIVNMLGLELPEMFWTNWEYFKGAYIVIGMMIIGCVLSGVSKPSIDFKFTSLIFIGKFLFMPLLGALFILIDAHLFGILTQDLRNIVVLITICPPASNGVALAAQLDVRPEKVAVTTLLGTFFALFYIPAIVWLVGIAAP